MNIELSTFNFTNPASFRDSWKLLQEAGSHPVKYSFEYENKAVLSRYSCCIESTIADTAKSVLAYEMNPVLNSPLDITDDLIRRIIDNNLETLTINYEFCEFEMSHVEFISTGFLEICECNPFRIANSMDTLKRINFEVILGRKVHSLKHAFSSFKELEFVNLRDTSRITDMSSMFEGASSFNQPISNWDTSSVTDMSDMFYAASSFNQPVGNWNVKKVKNMHLMFNGSGYRYRQPG